MFQKLFKPGKTQRDEDKVKFIVVVSGLPRSGTSMMMKMLAEGGLEIVKDELRTADEDNPNGYFEFEPVKKLAHGQHDWLAGANGKGIKVISALLEFLPQNHHYKIIFMEREIAEILESQRKMLAHLNEPSKTSDEEMEKQFREHLEAIKFWLARQPNMEVLYVSYRNMVSDSTAYCQSIADFVSLPLDVSKMRDVPNGSLYRNRVAIP